MSSSDHPNIYRLYILAGQSNMEGRGINSELPQSLKTIQKEVPIYHPNRQSDSEPLEDIGFWSPLQPGHGRGYRYEKSPNQWNEVHSKEFGPELSFSSRLRELRPHEHIALFKYAKGGSSIHPETPDDWGTWHPDVEGINQWTHFRHHYLRAVGLDDINHDGKKEILEPAGIIWMQGESDAVYSREIAQAYRENLERLITKMRELVGDLHLPVVLGQISDTGMEGDTPALPHAEIVQQAQKQFTAHDDHALLVRPPAGHGWLDSWHYDSKTYLELGHRFAEAMHTLLYRE